MSIVIEKIFKKAKSSKCSIVLTEATDNRIIEAAKTAVDQGIAKIILVGDPVDIEQKLGAYDKNSISIINPNDSTFIDSYAQELYELRKAKGLTKEDAQKLIRNPLYFGAMMVRQKDADGMVAGAATSSSDVLRAALQIVKLKPGVPIVSSCQILDLSTNQLIDADAWAMADGVVNINPNAEQLAVIAIETAKSMKGLLDIEPKVAMLSFSTNGSAKHEFIDKVVDATRLAKEQAPELLIDGELQFDAAIVKEIGKTKCPNSPIAGEANVLIFPDIQSGNIGYKIVERVGGAQFIGCIVQGLNRPINDMSRGCNANDVVNQIAITAVQAQSEQ